MSIERSDAAESGKGLGRVAEEKSPLKKVVNDALRRGLRSEPPPKGRFRVLPHSFGFRPGIDTTKLGQLVDELEAEAFAARQARASVLQGRAAHGPGR